jgi:hypothetical protein
MPATLPPAEPAAGSRHDLVPSLRVFYGHHKCATAWIDGILREVSLHLGARFRIVHRERDLRGAPTLGALVERESVDVLAYTNATAALAATLPPHRGFHVVRDPRDVIVSAYYSHLHSHSTRHWPELEAHREALRQLPLEEGLMREIEFSAPQFDDMAAWDYEQPHVLELRMEALTAAPRQHFAHVLGWLGLLDDGRPGVAGLADRAQLRLNRLNHRGRRFMPGRLPVFPVPRRRIARLPVSEMDRILHERSFARLTGGRSKGTENVRSHYRKGTPGDWRGHFTPAHTRVVKERWGDLLVRLGYETDTDWTP